MAATAAGFDINSDSTYVGYWKIGQVINFKWHAASGGATATLNIFVKSNNPSVSDLSINVVTKSTASSANWTVPESLLDRVGIDGSTPTITIKLISYGATFDNSFGGANFMQLQSYTNTLWNSFGTNKDLLVPTASNISFTDLDSVASGMNAYVIGKSIIKATYDVQFKHYAKPQSSDTDLTSNYNSTTFKSSGSSSVQVDSSTIPTIDRYITDSRTNTLHLQQALPSKTMYYQPLLARLTSDYVAGASDKTNLIWQLSRDTDVKFANATGNFIVIDHQAAGASTWTTDSTITAANASTATGTHTLTVGGLNGETMYTFRITVLTKYGNLVTKINAQTLKVSMDFLKGGTGVAFGQVAQRDGLDVYMKTYLNDNTTLNGNLLGDNNVMSVKDNLSSNDYKLYTKTGIYDKFFPIDSGQFGTSSYTRDKTLPLYINGGMLIPSGTFLEVMQTIGGVVQRLTMINPDAVYIRSGSLLGTSNEKWSDWQMVAGTMTAKPAYVDGFSDYPNQTVSISRTGNVVTVIGAVKNANVIKQTGASANTTKIFTIPDGMRPLNGQFVSLQASSQMNTFDLIIDASGNAGITRYGTTSNVDMGVNSWINVSCTYICAP